MNLIEQFRSDFFSAAFELTKAVFWKALAIYFITLIAFLILMLPLFLLMFNMNAGLLMDLFTMGTDPSRVVDFQNQIAEPNPTMIGVGMFVMIPVMLVITAWSYIAYYDLNDQQVRTGESNLSTAIKRGFSKQLLSMIGSMLLSVILALVLFGASGATFAISGFLGFILMVLVFGFFFRFILATASVVHGEKGGFASIQYSLNLISTGKAFKLFGLSILIGIIMIIAMIILSFVILGFNLIPGIGVFLGQIWNMLLQAAITIFMICCLSGLYFRYSDDDQSRETIENSDDTLLDSNLA